MGNELEELMGENREERMARVVSNLEQAASLNEDAMLQVIKLKTEKSLSIEEMHALAVPATRIKDSMSMIGEAVRVSLPEAAAERIRNIMKGVEED